MTAFSPKRAHLLLGRIGKLAAPLLLGFDDGAAERAQAYGGVGVGEEQPLGCASSRRRHRVFCRSSFPAVEERRRAVRRANLQNADTSSDREGTTASLP